MASRKRPAGFLGMNECIEASWWNKSNLRPCLIELGMDIWRIKHDEYPVNSQCAGKLRTIICYQLHHSLPSLFNTREFLRCLMIRNETLAVATESGREEFRVFSFICFASTCQRLSNQMGNGGSCKRDSLLVNLFEEPIINTYKN